jgi:predicted TPR repeat methyltransferase
VRSLQPLEEIEAWWENPDPWQYENNPDDINRRAMLLSVLPARQYQKVLDIGCGNGFVTERLPGKKIIGIDVSENALCHARKNAKAKKHITYLHHSFFDLPHLGWEDSFDLVIVTGVLYPQYIGKSEMLTYLIVDSLLKKSGHLVSCHIDEWYTCRFPYTTLTREYYPYREYNHILEVYVK